MHHPFTWLRPTHRLPLLAVLLAATLASVAVLHTQGAPLRERVPHGVVAYELAGTAERAERILAEWKDLRGTVRLQLQLDFGFMVVYPLCLALACAMLADTSSGRAAAAGRALAWAVLLAAPLDAVENLALLRMLDAGATDTLARIATVAAAAKFLVVLAALAYVVIGGMALLTMNTLRAYSQ